MKNTLITACWEVMVSKRYLDLIFPFLFVILICNFGLKFSWWFSVCSCPSNSYRMYHFNFYQPTCDLFVYTCLFT